MQQSAASLVLLADLGIPKKNQNFEKSSLENSLNPIGY